MAKVKIEDSVSMWAIVALVIGAAVVLTVLFLLVRTARRQDVTIESLHEARALTRLPEHVSTEMWFEAARQSQRASDRRRKVRT